MNIKIKANIISRNEIDVTVNKSQLLDCVKKWSLEQRLELTKDIIEQMSIEESYKCYGDIMKVRQRLEKLLETANKIHKQFLKVKQ